MAYTATETAAVECIICMYILLWNKFMVYLTSRLMNFRHRTYYMYILSYYIHCRHQPPPPPPPSWSEYWGGNRTICTITFLFTRLTRTDGSALSLMHRRPGTGFAPVERHRVVAHSGPFLLPFAAPGTAFGPLRPRRPSSVHCENKYTHIIIVFHYIIPYSRRINTSNTSVRTYYMGIVCNNLFEIGYRRHNICIPLYTHKLFSFVLII